jgi:fructose-1,6-bisphosphatase/inositol monophosphatase family enzyme
MQSALLDRLGQVLRQVADSEIASRFQRLAPSDVIGKPSIEDPTDVVTAADRAAEAELTLRLPELLPGSSVVGEEAVSTDPQVLERLRGKAPVWVVDPLDGTRNFAAGRGPFGTMVALVERGTLIASGIYLPLLGHMYLGAGWAPFATAFACRRTSLRPTCWPVRCTCASWKRRPARSSPGALLRIVSFRT